MDIQSNNINTIIGKQANLTGDVEEKGNIAIHGKIEGTVSSEGTIIIGKDGHVIGDLSAAEVKVIGKVKGDIESESTVMLEERSYMLGDIETDQITVEDGAKFEGKCDMNLTKVEKENLQVDIKDEEDLEQEPETNYVPDILNQKQKSVGSKRKSM